MISRDPSSFVCVVYEDNFVRANLSESVLFLLLLFFFLQESFNQVWKFSGERLYLKEI